MICKDPMSVKPYDDKEEGLENDCFRLSCKHAFHATCIISSLRANSSCPVCRDGEAPPPSSLFTFEIPLSDDEDNTLVELQSRTPQIQTAASNLNRSVKAYNIMRDKLRSERRKSLAIAMRDFRAKNRRRFEVEKERVRQSLDTYKRQVDSVAPEIEVVDLDELLKQQNTHAPNRHQDPMLTSFWFY